MGDVNYAPFIEKMQWSYSRVSLFDDCPYAWYLKYVYQAPPEKRKFFSSYGSFMHELIERYLSGSETVDSLVSKYLIGFSEAVGRAPNSKIYKNYFYDGLRYLRSLNPPDFEVVSLEQEINFRVGGLRFHGFLDCLGKTDRGFVIVDHKSRTLKPRSKRKVPTKTDQELDEYLAQLYLYASAVHEKYGEYPAELWLNCFRVPIVIKEPFNKNRYDEVLQDMSDKVARITETTDFPPNLDYFKCTNLCDMCQHCEYHELNSKSR